MLFLLARKYKSAAVFLTKVAGAGSAFLVNIAITRSVGTSLAGAYFVSLSIVTVCYAISRIGFGYSTYRFVAEASARENWGDIKKIGRISASIVAVFSCIVAVLFWVVPKNYVADAFKSVDVANIMPLISLTIPIYCVGSILSEVLKGIGATIQYAVFESLIIKVASAAAIFILATLIGINGAAIGFIIGNVFGLIFVSICVVILVRGVNAVNSAFNLENFLKSTFFFSIVSVSTVAMQWLAPVIVGKMLGSAQAAFFFTSYRTAAVLEFAVVSISAVAGPAFVKAYALNGFEELKSTANRTALRAALSVGGLAVPVLIFAPQIMSLYGGAYVAAAPILRILVIGQWINAPLGVYAAAAIAAKREKAMAAITTFSAVMGCCIMVGMTSWLGTSGTALASALTLIIQGALLSALTLWGRPSPAKSVVPR